jgi:ATP-dependent RNA helicase RhlE
MCSSDGDSHFLLYTNIITLKFTSFKLDERLLESIGFLNYEIATPVQQMVIPEVLSGHDVIACAQTGTGKTAAFLLPIIHHIINAPASDSVKALIIVPTRELAIQISQHVEGLSYFAGVSTLAVYGGGSGADYAAEQRALSLGADIVICTPGRMISHLNMGYVQLSQLQFLVLDEADRMLDMGFFDDIMRIISFLPKTRQSLLFSATMPSRIRDMARKIMQKPKEINIAISTPPEKIRQFAYVVYEDQKVSLVKHLVGNEQMKTIIVFCDTKLMVKKLTRDLKDQGVGAEEIHSDLEQNQRETVMNRFKSRQLRVLVATDIVSRGIDVEDIDMVINFNVPQDAEDYVHRVGRTARAEANGQACTLIGPREQHQFAEIEKLLGREVEKLPTPENLGQSPAYQPEKPSDRKSFRSNMNPKKNTNRKFRNQRNKPKRGN